MVKWFNMEWTPDTIIRLVVAIVVLIGAVILQVTTNEIPNWMLQAVSGILVFFFAITIPYSNDKGEGD